MKISYKDAYFKTVATKLNGSLNIRDLLLLDYEFRTKISKLSGNKQNKNNLKKLLLVFFDLLLVIISIFNMIIILFKKIHIAHYCIEKYRDDNICDIRSEYIFAKVPMSESINFIHVSSTFRVFNKLIIRQNSIYFESIVRIFSGILSAFSKKKYINLKLSVEIKLFKLLIKLLKIERMYCVDDPRYTSSLRYVCKKENIKTIGYMHGRFNDYHVGLFTIPFDVYIVFSEYYKSLYIKNVEKYHGKCDTKFLFSFIDKYEFFDKRNDLGLRNILIIEEDDVCLVKLEEYLKILNCSIFNLYCRSKPGNNSQEFLSLMKRYSIKNGSNFNLREACLIDSIDVVLGNHSTVLYESISFSVIPIKLNLNNDYGDNMINDGFVLFADSPSSLFETLINLKYNKVTFSFYERYSKAWGFDKKYAIDKLDLNKDL